MNIKKIIYNVTFFVLTFFVLSSPAFAATYYVDATNGNDSNSGLSETNVWKTIAKINASRFNPGDQILFKRGEVWREQLQVGSSGAEGRPITFGAYGMGNSPTITGANPITGWSLYNGTTFKAATLSVKPNQVFMDSARISKGVSPNALNDGEWFWVDGVLYLRNDKGHPIDSGKVVEASQRDYCILLNYPGVKNFIVIDSIIIEKANSSGIFVGSALNGFTLRNSVIQFCYYDGLKATGGTRQSYGLISGNTTAGNGKSGINITGLADAWVIEGNKSSDNCQVNTAEHDFCGGIYVWGNNSNVPNLITNMVIQRNEAYRNGIISPTKNRGAGIWLDDCGTGNIVRYNSVYNNNSNGIFLEATSDSKVYYNLVYANNGANQWSSAGIYIKGNGGRTASNNLVANNTVYSNWAGIGVATFGEKSQAANNIIINNISVGNVKNLYATLGGANNSTNGSENIYQHNCYGPETKSFIYWGQSDYSSYSAWELAYTKPTYSIKTDPQFIDPVSFDFRLLPTSQCIMAGADIGLKNDFFGNPLRVGHAPDIGAIEYGGKTVGAPYNLRSVSP